MKWVCLLARVPRALELMRKTFPTLAFAVWFVRNKDEIYPPLVGGSVLVMVVEACVDAASGSTCDFQNCSRYQVVLQLICDKCK